MWPQRTCELLRKGGITTTTLLRPCQFLQGIPQFRACWDVEGSHSATGVGGVLVAFLCQIKKEADPVYHSGRISEYLMTHHTLAVWHDTPRLICQHRSEVYIPVFLLSFIILVPDWNRVALKVLKSLFRLQRIH